MRAIKTYPPSIIDSFTRLKKNSDETVQRAVKILRDKNHTKVKLRRRYKLSGESS